MLRLIRFRIGEGTTDRSTPKNQVSEPECDLFAAALTTLPKGLCLLDQRAEVKAVINNQRHCRVLRH